MRGAARIMPKAVRKAVLMALVLSAAWQGRACAVDVYTIDFNPGMSTHNERHVASLLRAALDATTAQYGPYEFRTARLRMERDRLLLEMRKAKLVNLSVQATSMEWESSLIPIRIPVDKGVSSYRIALIDGRRQPEFDQLRGVQDLKKLALGGGRQWSTPAAFERAGFKVVQGNSLEGLHSMLAAQRFDYFPRALSEALFEQAAHVQQFPALALERGIAIYLPTPRYFFVAAGQQRLARRLERGLQILVADGRYDRIFHEFYDEVIERAGLRQRRLFKVENTQLSPQTPLANKAYWYDPFEADGR